MDESGQEQGQQEEPQTSRIPFEMTGSTCGVETRALISPDQAVCADCLREMMNPRDRRFRYPFISCRNCGPRFTVSRDVPYERSRTSMASFRMCAECQKEYDDTEGRRFRAEINACWNCGPQLQVWSGDGSVVDTPEPMREAMRLIDRDAIVAVKGLGGFHLACNARSEAAVNLLRERKRGTDKPFAVMFRRIEEIERACVVDDLTRGLLLSAKRPIVLLARRPESAIAAVVAPHNHFVGACLPYLPLHHLLFASGKPDAFVMSGGNLGEEPIAIDNFDAVQRLQGIADAFLVHDREIVRRCDDSVMRVTEERAQQLRRSRGFVPVALAVEGKSEPVLAVGGELRNTVCVVHGGEAFLSQHVGDLENLESYEFFQEAVSHLRRILEVHPKIIAYDLHPDYFATKWALSQEGIQLVGVQHHHAHVASCMAENQLAGKVIGVVLDGSGHGLDGAVWGGEVLLADYKEFERAAHFEYVPLPGGAAAIQEPWRMAVSYLAKHHGKNLDRLELPFLKSIDGRRLQVVQQMIDREIHSPRTSSCGRLFDAVAALVGIRSTINYDAQAAIELEMAAYDSADEEEYPFDLIPDGTHWQIGTLHLFQSILRDIQRQESAASISRRFHAGLARVFVEVAEKIREHHQLNRVCLSGGCFQNALLLELMLKGLREKSFEVYFHSQVPCGGGGISLGQAMVAANRTRV
jgi:hydrogenase maturation protein HypF